MNTHRSQECIQPAFSVYLTLKFRSRVFSQVQSAKLSYCCPSLHGRVDLHQIITRNLTNFGSRSLYASSAGHFLTLRNNDRLLSRLEITINQGSFCTGNGTTTTTVARLHTQGVPSANDSHDATTSKEHQVLGTRAQRRARLKQEETDNPTNSMMTGVVNGHTYIPNGDLDDDTEALLTTFERSVLVPAASCKCTSSLSGTGRVHIRLLSDEVLAFCDCHVIGLQP